MVGNGSHEVIRVTAVDDFSFGSEINNQNKAEYPKRRVIEAFRKVSDIYFVPKPWEMNGELYRWFGIRSVKSFMPSEIIRKLCMRRYSQYDKLASFTLKENTLEGAKKYEKYTRFYEGIHTLGVASGLLVTASYLVQYLPEGRVVDWTLVKDVGLVFVNLYPVMVQRYNRGRIYRLIKRQENRSK